MAGSAVAKIVYTKVGGSGLAFSPNISTADIGDTLEFYFYSSFHTAAQGGYSAPCMRGSLKSMGLFKTLPKPIGKQISQIIDIR
jgi:hypothetical protein